MKRSLPLFLLLLFVSGAARNASAVELKISPGAIERTLKDQLFHDPDGRYYLRGDRSSACYLYVDSPSVRFEGDRVVVHVKTHSRLGAGVFGKCVGLGFGTDAEVSVTPDAEGETIGFRDARMDHITGNKELDFLLLPFLQRKLPANMRLNAAELLRAALARSKDSTGYTLALEGLKVHSMLVADGRLTVDIDGALKVD